MKKIKLFRATKIAELDTLYEGLRESLASGFSEQQFNKKGQRIQSTLLAQIKVKTEEIQELNRTLRLILQK